MYRTDIDGLRALAVIPVVLFHFDFGFPGGWVGVDVFFVISGFLITCLLIRDLDEAKFTLSNFWERRARRILPASVAMTFGTLIAGWFFFGPDDFRSLGESAAMQSIFLSNFYFHGQSGYFTLPAELQPLLHTWSLAVEEQFYILFPLLLSLGWRRGRAFILTLLATLFLFTFVLSVIGAARFPEAAFYLLPFRAWEMLCGALLAVAGGMNYSFPQRWTREILGWGGVLAIAIPCIFYTKDTAFPGFAALWPCLGAVSIIASTGGRCSLQYLLSGKVPVFIGLISYSLYLWHWPMIVFAKQIMIEEPGFTTKLILTAACFFISVLSWKYIETPFRKKIWLNDRRHLGFASTGALAAVIATGLWIFSSDGHPSRFSEELQLIARGRTDRDGGLISRHNLSADTLRQDGFPVLEKGIPGVAPELLVWGDSHCGAILPGIREISRENKIHACSASRDATVPLLGAYKAGGSREQYLEFNDSVFDLIVGNSIKHVLLVGSWSKCIDPSSGTRHAVSRSLLRSIDCDLQEKHGSEQALKVFRSSLQSTVERLQGNGVKVWIMKEVPSHRSIVPNLLTKAVMAGKDADDVGTDVAAHRKQTARVDALFTEMEKAGVTLLDPVTILANGNGKCRVAYDGASLYYDTDHLTVTGAKFLKPLFNDLISEIVCDRESLATADSIKKNTPNRQ